MSNLIRIAHGLPVAPLLAALDAQPELWGEITARQDYPGSAHRDTEAVYLRWCESMDVVSVFNDLRAVNYPAAEKLPEAELPIVAMNNIVGGNTLGRAMLVKLKPGGYITPHVDEGAYADHYERFHLPLRAGPPSGNVFHVGEESASMRPGELWWFNHKRLHFVENLSSEPRIHLIVDIVAPQYRRERGA